MRIRILISRSATLSRGIVRNDGFDGWSITRREREIGVVRVARSDRDLSHNVRRHSKFEFTSGIHFAAEPDYSPGLSQIYGNFLSQPRIQRGGQVI